MRFHCMAMLLVSYFCCFFRPTAAEFALVILCFGMVMAFECANTAVEALSDRISMQHHPQLKLAKDAAAGAVLLVSIASAVCGLLLFLQQPRFDAAVRRIFTSPLWCVVLILLVLFAFWFIFVLPAPKKVRPERYTKEKKD